MRRSTLACCPRDVLIFIAAALALAGGCSRTPAAPAATAPPREIEDLRLVSLSPAITETLVALGLDGCIVGRSRFCTGVPADVPAVGDLRAFDAETMVRLAPTHLLVQPPATGLDPGLDALAAQQGWTLGLYRLDSLEDIDRLVRGLGETLAPESPTAAATIRQRTTALADRLQSDLAAVTDRGVPQDASPVLLLFSTSPAMAFGPDTYLGEILDRLGARNALVRGGYPELALEDIVRLRPNRIVLVQSTAVMPEALSTLEALDLPAARSGGLVTVVHPSALVPGPAVVEVAEAMRAALARSAADSTAPAEDDTPPLPGGDE